MLCSSRDPTIISLTLQPIFLHCIWIDPSQIDLHCDFLWIGFLDKTSCLVFSCRALIPSPLYFKIIILLTVWTLSFIFILILLLVKLLRNMVIIMIKMAIRYSFLLCLGSSIFILLSLLMIHQLTTFQHKCHVGFWCCSYLYWFLSPWFGFNL